MTVTWDNSARLEGGPNVLGDLLVRDVLADLASHLLDPSEDLLVGKTGTTLATIESKTLTRGGDRRDR